MKVFITFGAGGQNYIDAGKRLIKQAKSTGYFDKIILYTEKDLKNDNEFWNQHSIFISKNKRGYGYWIWKSYIIKKTMEIMKDGDILLYLDCGCEIGDSIQLLIPRFFNDIENDKIIGTKTKNEKEWCKMDLLLHFDMQDSNLIHTSQHQAGAIMFYICEKTKFIVDLWYNTGCDYHMIDDSPSIKTNLNCFKEHRHDQAIFSLITKKYNIYSNKSLYNCIYYLRNKSGFSKLGKSDS
uniref:Glycosyltransferase n=1 Tax=viral metagenome TaxID=1070528 RepID=A0A6C0JCG4_9ZZZZ